MSSWLRSAPENNNGSELATASRLELQYVPGTNTASCAGDKNDEVLEVERRRGHVVSMWSTNLLKGKEKFGIEGIAGQGGVYVLSTLQSTDGSECE